MSKSKPIRAFKFKTKKAKGTWAWLHNPTHTILYDKHIIGMINPEAPHKIMLKVTKTV